MFNKSQVKTNAILLKYLLIDYKTCPDQNILPKNTKEWGSFIDMAYRNRLVILLCHFVSCPKCSKLTPNNVKETVQKLYLETVIRYHNYQKIKNKIKQFIKKTGTSLILIKDLNAKLIKKYYPPYYIPLKFDVDVLGRYKDLPKFRKFIVQIGYNSRGCHYGWLGKLIPQYKFRPKKKKFLLPSIEFRYKAITVPPSHKNILEVYDIDNFTEELWRNTDKNSQNFSKLTEEYLLMHLFLIYYLEDHCKGLNNLYRIILLCKDLRNKLYHKNFDAITKQYRLKNIFLFVAFLAAREFPWYFKKISSNKLTGSVKLATRLINTNYISSVYLNFDNPDFHTRKDIYLKFLAKGLLAEDTVLQKIIFFLNPKRLFFLVWGLIFQ